MSFASCIKVPVSKHETTPERENTNRLLKDPSSSTYNELIAIANEVLGQGNWSHSVTSQTVDFVEYVMGKYHIGCAAFVRVQLADGTFHEDMGYSNAESSVKGSAIYSARASSITYALKKALVCFGGPIQAKINKMVNQVRKHKLSNEEKIPSAVDTAKELEEPISKTSRSNSLPKRPKSPIVLEPEKLELSVKNEIIRKEKSDPSPIKINTGQTIKPQSNLQNHGPGVSESKEIDLLALDPKSEEEAQRLERKRKQMQKQEEFRKLIKEKGLNGIDKPNARF